MPQSIYRIDKFIVPQQVKAVFLSRIQETHQLLRTLPGFVRDLIVEKVSGAGEFNFVTTVEWQNLLALEQARQSVHNFHASIGFNPQEFFDQLGVKADLANYKEVSA
jgi:hypothetical protein